ncbi:MAG TPA: SRPBCC domain-containing protein [Opitutaceae bacterium]|nr:SRPBCC domain-containing protein [Opitutaceae bacterium]
MGTPTAKNKAADDYAGREFVITREFAAPRELVFKAWTDPKHLAQWWGPKGFTNPVCEWDVRPGGKIYDIMRAPNGDEYPMGGEFREIVAPERLVFTSGALDKNGKMLFEFLHTATFTEQNGKTRLLLRSRVLSTTADAARYIGGFETGMTMSLERLGAHLAQRTEPLLVERIFDAPVSLVWAALTTREGIVRWSFSDLSAFKPEPGFEFSFTGEKDGRKFLHRCKVTEAIPEKRLAYSWRYEGHAGDSLVSFDLFAEGVKTRLRLTHLGLESFPPVPDFARENFEFGWTSLIGSSLKEAVEQDAVARQIVVSRVFDAPRELVWEAWTDPKQVVKWWGPAGFTTTIEKMDVRPGGVWQHVMHGPDGANYPNKSVFVEVVKPERIVYTHGGGREGGPGVSFKANWIFEETQPGKTRLTIHMIFPSPADRDRIVKEFGAIEGGRQTLERLAEHLAKK